MDYFKGIIKCQICGGNYNKKFNNGQEEFLCATKKNYGRIKCDSRNIKQQFLVDIIKKHCELNGKSFTIEKTKLFVKLIKIDNDGIKILYKDGTTSEIANNSIRF